MCLYCGRNSIKYRNIRRESRGELKNIEIEYSDCEKKFNTYKNLWMKQHFLIHLDTLYNVRTVEEWCEKYDSLNCDTTFSPPN